MKKTAEDELAYVGKDCYNPLVNAYYVGVHAITKRQYDKMIHKYLGNNPPKERQILPTSIDLGVTCMDHAIKFEATDDRSSNDDITVKVDDIKMFDGKYSIHFFRGLNLFFWPLRYEFSKAMRNGRKTLVVRVIDRSGHAAFHGDLTNMYP